MRTALAVGLLLAGLTACGTATPQDALVERVGALTERANAEDAEGVREAALALQDEVSAQRRDGDLSAGQAERLIALATQVRERADLVDPAVRERQAAQAREAAERAAAEKAAAEAAEKAAAEKAAAEAAAAERAAAERAREQDDERRGKGGGKKDDDEGDEGDD